MSTELGEVECLKGTVSFTQYFGGASNGMCVQVTQNNGSYVSLTEKGAAEVVGILQAFLGRVGEPIIPDSVAPVVDDFASAPWKSVNGNTDRMRVPGGWLYAITAVETEGSRILSRHVRHVFVAAAGVR